MKETYCHPTMEFLLVSIEEGACQVTSPNEQFNTQPGSWNTGSTNF